jgi:hypothetical protein
VPPASSSSAFTFAVCPIRARCIGPVRRLSLTVFNPL